MFQWLFNLAGHGIRRNLDLKGGLMDDTKKWWQSLTIWSGIVTGLIGIYLSLIASGIKLPDIPPWLITILSGMGVYGRVKADTKIS